VRKRIDRSKLITAVILGLVAIFIFAGFYKQYVAVWTELFTFMMFFMSCVGVYIAASKEDDER